MMGTSHSNRIAGLLVALLVLTSGMGGMAAADYTAPPGADTSTTDDTASTTDLAPGENRTYNESQSETVQWISDSNKTQVEVARNGSDYTSYTNGSASVVFWNSTDLDGHYNATFSHSELADIEHKINENVTVDLVFTNNTSAASPSVGTSQWYLEFGDATTTEVISDSDVASEKIVTLTNKSGWFTLDADNAEVETTERNVTKNTSVVLVMGNSSVASDYDDAASEASSGDKLSSLFSTSRTVVLLTDDEGTTEAVPVYYKSAPSDVASSDTYAVQKRVGGTTALVINPGSEFDKATTLEAHAIGNAGSFTFLRHYALGGLGNLFSMTFAGFGGVGLAGLAVAGRRRSAEV